VVRGARPPPGPSSYAKARYFDPKLGRFLTQDSFLGEIDEPPSLHRYLYGYANPTTFMDPTGHYSWRQFGQDVKWGADFIVAFNADLTLNAPERALRIAGATLEQAGNLAVQTAAMAHDTAVLSAEAAVRATTGQGFDNVTLYSELAQGSAQRLGRGESAGDIIKDSAFELGANALTVGTYGTFKEQFSTAADYLSGNASIEQVESRLIGAAGGAVLNAALGSAGAKVAGEGWLGKPVPVPSAATVVESVTQLPGRARAAVAEARAVARGSWDSLTGSGSERGAATIDFLTGGLAGKLAPRAAETGVVRVGTGQQTWMLPNGRVFTDQAAYIRAMRHRHASMVGAARGRAAHQASAIQQAGFKPSNVRMSEGMRTFIPEAVEDLAGNPHLFERKTAGYYAKSMENNIYPAAIAAGRRGQPFTLDLMGGAARVSHPLWRFIQRIQGRFGGEIR
jgi:hypothetical protein